MIMNVLDLLRNKNIEAKKAAATGGGEYWSACPGCGGTDRFHIWPDQNGGTGSYWCRGCEKHGDNIQFLMDFDGKSYPEACAALDVQMKNADYRTPRPISSWMGVGRKEEIGKRKEEKPSLPPDLWVEKAGKFVDWAHEKLLADKKQLEWLKNRGINRAAIEKWKLGWNPGKDGKDLFRPRESWGLPTVLKDNGWRKALWLPIGLLIPMLKNGRVARIRIRRPEGEPRYYVIPGSGMDVMFTGENCRAYTVVESELDMILIDQAAGDLVGVVGLGTAGVKPGPELMEMLRKSAVILLSHDYDKAGAKAKTWWEEQFPQAERWPVPVGGDPGEAFQAGIDIRAWVSAGLPRAWFIGQSLLDRKKEGAGAINQDVGDGPVREKPALLPDGVLELADLLKQHPVMIVNSPERLKVCEGQKWAAQNWEVSTRISHLVYMTPEVFEFLAKHPDEKISGENILIEQEVKNGKTKQAVKDRQ
jgi:DNA primase